MEPTSVGNGEDRAVCVWIFPDGTKVNVLPLEDGDLFRFMNRDDGPMTGVSRKGAINFVMLVRQWSYVRYPY